MAQHISIRIPWHDNGYNGTVCKNPCDNTACLRLKNIHKNRKQDVEKTLAGTTMKGHEQELVCIGEGGACMSSQNLYRETIHNYKENGNEQYQHFIETRVKYPAYSLPARPFRWLMKNDSGYDYELYGIDYDESREPVLDFETNWVQDAENHRTIFDYFYHDVIPGKSLCVIYAKQVPFVEDSRRVIMGIGFVNSIVPAIEHKHTDEGNIRSMVWETMICHSIREDRQNGFMLPYQELMLYAKEHPDFDISETVVFEPENSREEFSYATEHITHDSVIEVLLETKKVLLLIRDIRLAGGNWAECVKWIDERINEVWIDRGLFPGLGPMLLAAGFNRGLLLAEKIKNDFNDGENFWDKLDILIDSKACDITDLEINTWKKSIIGDRRNLFRLLSRISLSIFQADILFNPENREEADIFFSDTEILKNPYFLYERTRECPDVYCVSIRKVDKAMFPPPILQKKYLSNDLMDIPSANDERRIRAIMINEMEKKANQGHTIYPGKNLVLDINEIPIDPQCHITVDNLNAIRDSLFDDKDGVMPIEMKNGENAYKLKRYEKIDNLLKGVVDARTNARSHVIEEEWREILDTEFNKRGGKGKLTAEEKKLEEKARTEKAACMKVLAESKLSVLIGGAGTGKTTLLSLLCSSKKIQNGGILVLAPTGKARVKLSTEMKKQNVQHTAHTIAQFAHHNGHYNADTRRYFLNEKSAENLPDTVIVDECSMLTEEMMGALFELTKKAKRIILVGDPNQLPPIGAGRPFVDLVEYLRKNFPENVFPRVCNCYGQLTVPRRQTKGNRLDAELAKWFISNADSGDDDIFARLQADELRPNVRFKQWITEEELQACIFEIFAEELGITSKDDVNNFNLSLGGHPKGESNNIHFNKGDAKGIDNWQILAPLRNLPPYGVNIINHLIHDSYRSGLVEMAQRKFKRKIHKPLGPETIVYSDKVINLHNKSRKKRLPYPPHENIDDNYIANGEIGVVVDGFLNPKYFNIEFSSQQGRTYSFSKKDFSEEGDILLELAYALTVHKAQGSEFNTVILILGEPCRLLSRELLYTALTRQTEKLVILYNDEAYKLRSYSSDRFSDISRRFTGLFEQPDIVGLDIDKKRYFFEDRLIHRTLKGHLVRSKSELVIANRLYEKNIDYDYEKPLLIDGETKYPDFTITTLAGDTFYWEHCGMIGDSNYELRWEQKKRWYAERGIEEGKNLIISSERLNSGLDSQNIDGIINEYFK